MVSLGSSTGEMVIWDTLVYHVLVSIVCVATKYDVWSKYKLDPTISDPPWRLGCARNSGLERPVLYILGSRCLDACPIKNRFQFMVVPVIVI
jgi:hypothetical protein